MSIASEIYRIATNVSNALDAIAAKGVDVPSSANSDDLADLIEEIASADPVTPVFTGGGISGTATASAVNASVSTETNNSGVTIDAECDVVRSDVVYDGNTYGIVDQDDGDIALAGTSESMTPTTYYINGVTITAPESGTRTFSVTVPNGSGNTITFVFTVDANGNTTIE